MNRNPREPGFTLIEILIYLGVLSLILIALGGVATNVLTGGERAEKAEEISYNGRYALNQIAYQGREAVSITAPAAGATSSSLTLEGSNGAVVFDLDNNNRLQITEAGSEPEAITSWDVKITELRFTNATRSGGRGTVTVEMTMESELIWSQDLVRDWQSTVHLRSNP